MAVPSDSQNQIIASETNLDCNPLLRHLSKQSEWAILLHDVDSVPNTLRVANLNCLAYMRTQSTRRNLYWSKLSSMLGEMDVRIELVEVIEDLHVERVVIHRRVAVFGHYRIHRNKSRISFHYRKARHDLGEHLLLGCASINFVDVPDRDLAAGICLSGIVATKHSVLFGFGIV